MTEMKVRIGSTSINQAKRKLDGCQERLRIAKANLKSAKETVEFWDRQVSYAKREYDYLKASKGKIVERGRGNFSRQVDVKFAMEKAKRKRKSK